MEQTHTAHAVSLLSIVWATAALLVLPVSGLMAFLAPPADCDDSSR
jgi:hypothetical protein